MFALSSRGLYQSIMKEQQEKSSVTKKLVTTVDMKSGSVNRPQRGTEGGSDSGQPHAGQGSDATRVRKELMSKMDTPKQQKEVCTGHSKDLHSSPSVPCNTQHPLQGHKPPPQAVEGCSAAPLPQGRGEASALLLTPRLGTAPMPGSRGSSGSSLPEGAEAQSGRAARRRKTAGTSLVPSFASGDRTEQKWVVSEPTRSGTRPTLALFFSSRQARLSYIETVTLQREGVNEPLGFSEATPRCVWPPSRHTSVFCP